MKLAVHLLTWNGAKYIPYLFSSLRAQTFKDWQLFVLDNNSTDNTVKAMEKELSNFAVQYSLEVKKENVGFVNGHNQMFDQSNSEYIVLLNQDISLDKYCLERMVDFLDNNDYACVSPRLMKWRFPDNFTDKIDSLGLKVYKNRRVVEYLRGKNWNEIANDFFGFIEMFGVSGALPMFRREAIKNILEDGNIFDNNFKSYKEDVDLAYRLNAVGLKAGVILDAVAYHDRTGSSAENENDFFTAANKRKQLNYVKYNSYKNHLMAIYKNEYWQNFTIDFLWILWYELKKFCWFAIFDRKVLSGLKEVWHHRFELKNKRNEIKIKRKLNWREMRKRIFL